MFTIIYYNIITTTKILENDSNRYYVNIPPTKQHFYQKPFLKVDERKKISGRESYQHTKNYKIFNSMSVYQITLLLQHVFIKCILNVFNFVPSVINYLIRNLVPIFKYSNFSESILDIFSALPW